MVLWIICILDKCTICYLFPELIVRFKVNHQRAANRLFGKRLGRIGNMKNPNVNGHIII